MKKMIKDKIDNTTDAEKKYFLLNPECYFVKGAKNSAIYKLDSSRVIWLKSELTNMIEKCEKGNPLMNIDEFLVSCQHSKVG